MKLLTRRTKSAVSTRNSNMLRSTTCKFRFLKRTVVESVSLRAGNKVKLFTTPVRWKSHDTDSRGDKKVEIPNTISIKYVPFSEENAPIILDIEEERRKIVDECEEEIFHDEFGGLNLKRGLSGVFDIEDLVEVLKRENAVDLFVVRIPPEYQYADYMVIVTAKSNRHMKALAEFVRRLFKKKMNEDDRLPKLEGKGSHDWMALDLSNIVLHIFSSSAREYYDLETLWAVGKEFDSQSKQKATPLDAYLTDYTKMLADLTPDIPQKE